MHIPKPLQVTDRQEILSFMRTYSFATIVTIRNNIPNATHLPFSIQEEGEHLFLYSHFAKVNEQWKELAKNPVLVIFAEPHAYISTAHYDREQNVPTWNYMAIHTYGNGQLISDKAEALHSLDHMIHAFEKEYKAQWDGLPEKYRDGMLKAIIPFKIQVTDIQAKKKISQNRSDTEKQRIIQALDKSEDSAAKAIAELMKKEKGAI